MSQGIVVGGGKLYCRTRPSKGSDSYGQFDEGQIISVTNYDSTWYSVKWGNGIGYVMKAFVATVNDTVQVRKSSVNVRSGAGTNYSSLYQLSYPATATVLSFVKQWVKIQPTGKAVGWMKSEFLDKHRSSSGGGTNPPPGQRPTKPAEAFANGTLRIGNKGNAVKNVQLCMGFTGNAIDGIFGTQTENAVINYQDNHRNSKGQYDLAADGVVGTSTKVALWNDYETLLRTSGFFVYN